MGVARGVVAQESEVVEHRVAGEADLAGDAQPLGLGLDSSLEGDAVIGAERFHSVEPFEKIEMPHGAAEFPICRAAQSGLRLSGDDALDRGILSGAQLGGGDFAARTPGSRILQGGRAEQAADVIGAERWCCACHIGNPA